MTQKCENPRLRVDTHVHMHPCFDQDRFLDSAADKLCEQSVDASRVSGVLCLTETSDSDWYHYIASDPAGTDDQNSHWQFKHTNETNSVLATDGDGSQIAIVAGRQIVTREGLEVLALGLAEPFEDGQPTRQVLKSVDASGAVPVLPWGFGKWTAGRGKLVRKLIDDQPCAFFLGDNGGRLSIASEPREFAYGRSQGLEILPGTDPFPFPWDERRVGSFGVEWETSLDALRPFAKLKSLLSDPTITRRSFGQLERLPHFLRNQLAIQVRKQARKLRR